MKKKIIIVFLILLTSSLFASNGIEGVMVNIKKDIIDLREGGILNKRNGDITTSSFSDLKIGSIFIDTDGIAKEVESIIEDGSDVIIETKKPRIENVIDGLYIPQQKINLGYENIIQESIAEGITVAPGSINSISRFGPLKRGKIFDPDIEVSVEIDFSKFLELKKLSKSKRADFNNKRTKFLEKLKNSGTNITKIPSENDAGAALKWTGQILIDNVGVDVGASLPYIKAKWVSRWWGGYPRFYQVPGYIKYTYEYEYEKNIAWKGEFALEHETKILLFAFGAPGGKLANASLGVYAVLRVDGSISINIEEYEYEKVKKGSSTEVVFGWSLFSLRNRRTLNYPKENESLTSTLYSLSADANMTAGVAVGFDLAALGFTLAEVEALIGGYLTANAIVYYEDKSIDGKPVEDDRLIPLNASGTVKAGILFDVNASFLDGLVNFNVFTYRKEMWGVSTDD